MGQLVWDNEKMLMSSYGTVEILVNETGEPESNGTLAGIDCGT
jgi:hypothetical protein